MEFFKFAIDKVDNDFDVAKRLLRLQQWQAEYVAMDTRLGQRVLELGRERNDAKEKRVRNQIERKMALIGIQRRRIRSFKIREPLEVPDDILNSPDSSQVLWERLRLQYVRMDKAQKKLWMNNLFVLMTSDLYALVEWLLKILEATLAGEQMNLLVGGDAGVGKTSAFNFLYCLHLPELRDWYTYAPIILTEAIDDDKTTKSLMQQLILGTGENYVDGDSVPTLLNKCEAMVQVCQSLLLFVDEIMNLREGTQRRRLIDLMNRTRLSVIGTGVNPLRFRDGDTQIATRFPYYFPMEPYTGERLYQFLNTVDLLLPLPQRAFLGKKTLTVLKEGKKVEIEGSAPYIDRVSKGSLRTVMNIVLVAANKAIDDDLPTITPAHLYEIWPTSRFSDKDDGDSSDEDDSDADAA